jgi:hypothetical protein
MNGWPIVGWATLAVLAIVGCILAVVGTDAEGLRMAIRATAGAYYNWFIFALSFLPRTFKSPVYSAFAALVGGSMLARWLPAPQAVATRPDLRGTAA